MYKILIIDDSRFIHDAISQIVEAPYPDFFTLHHAFSFKEGMNILAVHKDMDVIVLDVRLGEEHVIKDELILLLRVAFGGILVGISAEPSYLPILTELGCEKVFPKISPNVSLEQTICDYLLSLMSEVNYTLITGTNNVWIELWAKEIKAPSRVKMASTMNEVLEVASELRDKLKLVVLPEEFIVSDARGPMLATQMRDLGFAGTIIYTSIGESQISDDKLYPRDQKMNRLEVRDYLRSGEACKLLA